MATAKGCEADSKGGGNTAPSSSSLPGMLVQLRYAAVVRLHMQVIRTAMRRGYTTAGQ